MRHTIRDVCGCGYTKYSIRMALMEPTRSTRECSPLCVHELAIGIAAKAFQHVCAHSFEISVVLFFTYHFYHVHFLRVSTARCRHNRYCRQLILPPTLCSFSLIRSLHRALPKLNPYSVLSVCVYFTKMCKHFQFSISLQWLWQIQLLLMLIKFSFICCWTIYFTKPTTTEMCNSVYCCCCCTFHSADDDDNETTMKMDHFSIREKERERETITQSTFHTQLPHQF